MNILKNRVHQTFLVIDAFFQGNHGFGSGNPFDIVHAVDDLLSVAGILCPDLTKDIELPGGNMRYGNKGDFIDSLQNELSLGGFLEKDSHISDKRIS